MKKIAGDGGRGQIVCVVAESSDKARTLVLVSGEDGKSQNPNSSVGNE
jgi:hypothetical protein